jgi:hypothetical protein
VSTELLALASIANKMRLAVLSSKDLRKSMSTVEQDQLSSDVLAEMDKAWWDLRASVDRARGPVDSGLDAGSMADPQHV